MSCEIVVNFNFVMVAAMREVAVGIFTDYSRRKITRETSARKLRGTSDRSCHICIVFVNDVPYLSVSVSLRSFSIGPLTLYETSRTCRERDARKACTFVSN